MGLIGKFFGGKDENERKKGESARHRRRDASASGRSRRTAPKGDTERVEKSPPEPPTDKDKKEKKTNRSGSTVVTPGPGEKGRTGRNTAFMRRPPSGAAPTPKAKSGGSGRRKRASMKGKQVGSLLVKAEAITESQLDQALAWQKENGGLLGQILVAQKMCTKGDVAQALGKQRTITTVDLSQARFDPEATSLLPRDFCMEHRLVPFEKAGNFLCLAMSNVLDAQAKNEVREKTGMQQLKVFDAAWRDIQRAIENEVPDAAGGAAAAAETEEAQTEGLVIELPEEDRVDAGPPPEPAAEAASPAPMADEAEAADQAAPETETLAEGDAVEELEDVEEIDLDGFETIEIVDVEEDEEEEEPPAPPAPEPEAEPVAAGEIEEIEEVEAIELVEEGAYYLALPLGETYAAATLADGRFHAERAWLAAKRGAARLPARPLPPRALESA